MYNMDNSNKNLVGGFAHTPEMNIAAGQDNEQIDGVPTNNTVAYDPRYLISEPNVLKTTFLPWKYSPVTVHEVKVYKDNPNAELPEYGTQTSSCFDLKACLDPTKMVTYWDAKNRKKEMDIAAGGIIWIDPGERVLVPTGLIFDLEEWQDLRIHPRSGLAVKNGITLINAEGVIDPDYVNPTFISLVNTSFEPFMIKHGERIAQGEIQIRSHTNFSVTETKPEQKTNRAGGVGSTGR